MLLERSSHFGQWLHQGERTGFAAPDGEHSRVTQPLLNQDPRCLPISVRCSVMYFARLTWAGWRSSAS